MSTVELASISSRRSRSRVLRHGSDVPSRGIALLETVALVVIVVLLIVGILATSGHSDSRTHTTRVFVNSGDTVWTIAATHPVAGETTEQVAERIAQLNDVQGSLLANTAIEIPTPAVALSALACR